ncbi:hypothetical protein [Kangiella sp. TOML190]|uniref:hypothetical protein n=1 Tax=Kangiella sp. TOML190 TaxID=2931351 RepID=UPI00203D2A47|nr:hypothetical protein [Kangiella sp. TOML190]
MPTKKDVEFDQKAWKEVSEIRKELLKSNFQQDLKLEEHWNHLMQMYKGDDYMGDFIDREVEGFRHPIQSYMDYIFNGYYPPPELLMWIYNKLLDYYSASGQLELEYAFFGKRTQNSGNDAKRDFFHRLYQDFHHHMIMRKQNSRKPKRELTQVKLAEDFFELNKPFLNYFPDYDSFLRQYRRWKKLYSDN